ncbi:hypothetical protein BDR03DRAFT_342167 [Suillus americanus]|nr:hypothetical protein BDR03DRAFT_342167 [Suillus americanus]
MATPRKGNRYDYPRLRSSRSPWWAAVLHSAIIPFFPLSIFAYFRNVSRVSINGVFARLQKRTKTTPYFFFAYSTSLQLSRL